MRHFPIRAVLLFCAVSLAVIVPFCIWGDAITVWTNETLRAQAGNRGFLAVVLFSLLASDIFLPVPSSLASTACGIALGFWGGLLVSFFAMNVSALAGYLLGRFCADRARRVVGERDMEALDAFQRRYGRWLLLALRPVPVLAEASTVFAGIGHEPPAPATAMLLTGNLAVSAVYAAIGAWGKAEDSMIPAFLATMLLSGLCILVVKGRRPR